MTLRDLTGRGGDNFAYRLAIRPPAGAAEAGFVARFLPDTLRVSREGITRLRCEVTRNGFDGPVRFDFADLPAGVFSEPLVLTAMPASGLMLITATKEARPGNYPLKLTASAVVGGKTVTRTAEPILGEKPVQEAFLTVLEASPFTLELATLSASVEQNQSTIVEVLAQRREGFAGEIKLSAEGFSAGREPVTKSFDVTETTLKAGETLGKITLKPKLDSETGTRTLVIRGEATVAGQPVVQYSRTFPVSVSQVPFVVSSTLSRLSVTAVPAGSTSAAGETFTTIKVERRAGFTNELLLTLDGVPAGISTTLEKIPANASETILKLVATDKAAPGTNYSFTILGAGMHNDRNYKHRTAPIALTINAPSLNETASTNAPVSAAAK